MRYLVLTDIHANLEALDACLADARPRGYDGTLVLGDVVGYGADPNAVVRAMRNLQPAAIVRGNHDKVASGLEPPDGFNTVAKRAVVWTYSELTPEHREWLAALPRGPHSVDDRIEICHGAPFDEDAYVFDELDAIRALEAAARPLCLFGHTHWAVTFAVSGAGSRRTLQSRDDDQIFLEDGLTYLVNPGAVGQPRDGDPRAAYAIVDTAQALVELFRATYPVEEAQAKIIQAGLPEALAARLAVGR